MVDFLLRPYVENESEEGQGLAEYALILALIAVDAEGRACGVGKKGQSTGSEAVREGDAERLEGFA